MCSRLHDDEVSFIVLVLKIWIITPKTFSTKFSQKKLLAVTRTNFAGAIRVQLRADQSIGEFGTVGQKIPRPKVAKPRSAPVVDWRLKHMGAAGRGLSFSCVLIGPRLRLVLLEQDPVQPRKTF